MEQPEANIIISCSQLPWWGKFKLFIVPAKTDFVIRQNFISICCDFYDIECWTVYEICAMKPWDVMAWMRFPLVRSVWTTGLLALACDLGGACQMDQKPWKKTNPMQNITSQIYFVHPAFISLATMWLSVMGCILTHCPLGDLSIWN